MPINFIEFPDKAVPITSALPLPECEVAGKSFRELQNEVLSTVDETVYVRSTAWIDPLDLQKALESRTDIISNNKILLASSEKRLHEKPDACDNAEKSFEVFYAWDLLKVNEYVVGELSKNLIEGEVHSAAEVDGLIEIGKGTRILPGVFIEGNVIIGKNCKIGPNCYIRGNTYIGDNCHIGQSVEIKNCIIMSETNVGHLSYVGDSVLGQRVNFGAGTTSSNLRHDNGNHRSMIDGELVDTGRRKFGVIVGDGVHTGINTSFYPGRKMWPGTNTLPAEIVKKDKLSI